METRESEGLRVGDELRPDAGLRYCILDPTGNITALVESDVEVGRQPSVGVALMRRHPEVEQVGFVRRAPEGDVVQAELRMAGGEFCGNATMSAAVLHLLRSMPGQDAATSVWMRVSGASQPVEVRLEPAGDLRYRAAVCMPAALGIDEMAFSYGQADGLLPVVRMEGISHIVIDQDSAFFWLRDDRAAAQQAVRSWCADLGADGLGLMFLEGQGPELHMTPLVYIPGGDTMFWENSCASGSSAVGMCLAEREGAAVDVCLREPGGVLRVVSEPGGGTTWLHGSVRLVEQLGS